MRRGDSYGNKVASYFNWKSVRYKIKMKLSYGSDEANLSIILLSIITTENVALLHWQRQRG